MIKREYFLAGEVSVGVGKKVMFYRFYWVKSFLPNNNLALEIKMKEIAKEMDVDFSDLAITAFNRV